jgi:hypothetical protein
MFGFPPGCSHAVQLEFRINPLSVILAYNSSVTKHELRFFPISGGYLKSLHAFGFHSRFRTCTIIGFFAFFPYLSYIGKAFVCLRMYVWPSVSSRERLEDRGRLCHHFSLDCDFALGLF